MRWCHRQTSSNERLKRLQQTTDLSSFRFESQSWAAELQCNAEEIAAIPSLPSLMAEELQLAEVLDALQVEHEHVSAEMTAAQQAIAAREAEAEARTEAAGDVLSHWSVIRSCQEDAAIASAEDELLAAYDALTILTDRMLTLSAERRAAECRLADIPGLQKLARETLEELDSVAVGVRDQRDWTYEYAADMSEVGPSAPDSGLTERIAARAKAGMFDCDTFVVHVLQEAGYDLDIEITVGDQTTTARRFAMLHAETILRDEFGFEDDIPFDAEDRRRILLNMVLEGDPRMAGVVNALTLSGQGTEVTDKNDLRPGDLMQYWYLKDKGRGAGGHAVVINKVRTSEGVLDERSPASNAPVRVLGVGLLSAHSKQVSQSDVFTTGFVDPDAEYLRWFAVRPAGSRWNQGAQPR